MQTVRRRIQGRVLWVFLTEEVVSMTSDHLVSDRRASGAGLALDGVLVATSTGWRVATACGRLLSPLVRVGLRPPLLSPRLCPQRFLRELSDRGRANRMAVSQRAEAFASAAIPWIVSEVLDRLDLTAMIVDRVDLDAVANRLDLEPIIARVDVDDVAARVDLDAIVERLDILGLTFWVLERIDLPGIIRESSSSVASHAVKGARVASLEADQAVSSVIDRLLMRRQARNIETPWGRTNTGDGGVVDDDEVR
jgi:hypothetical protein